MARITTIALHTPRPLLATGARLVLRLTLAAAILPLALLSGVRAQAPYSSPPASSSTGSGWSLVPGLTQDMVVVLAVGALLLTVLVLWAVFLRKKPREHGHSGSSHRARPADERPDAPEDGESGHHRHRQRRRRHRRSHRTRNPTLAETGGLPPPRSEGQAPPAA